MNSLLRWLLIEELPGVGIILDQEMTSPGCGHIYRQVIGLPKICKFIFALIKRYAWIQRIHWIRNRDIFYKVFSDKNSVDKE